MTATDEWTRTLTVNAASYAEVALTNIRREFPADVRHLMRAADDLPRRPREHTPVFYGSFDWHSCVEMHWVLVRLLRLVPDAVDAAAIRAALDEQFTGPALAAEAEFIARPGERYRQRPYGWGWALSLGYELAALAALDDARAAEWSARYRPMADAVTRNFLDWFPNATYPVRYGVHPNSAFGLSRSLPYARLRAAAGDPVLLDGIIAVADRWFAGDTDYPAGWEPSGADFLSPALAEAELMAQVLPAGEFPAWFGAFLPGVADRRPAALFTPAVVSDGSDGQIAHLHGLNASRAWCWRRIAEELPPGDARVEVALEAMRHHAEAALPHVAGEDYMVEHWLVAYALLLLS